MRVQKALALALPLVEIAPGEHTPHVEPRPIEGLSGQGLEVPAPEVPVEVDAGNVGRPVKERTSVLTKKIPKATVSASG